MVFMTVADLYDMAVSGGTRTAVGVLLFPALIALLSLVLQLAGRPRASQAVANLGIAIGLAAVSVEVLGLVYAMDRHGVDPLSDVSIPVLLAPLYLLVAAVVSENIIHPGPQAAVRQRLRRAALALIAVVVLYWILSQLSFHMLVLTNLFTFGVFILVLIGALYYVARRFL